MTTSPIKPAIYGYLIDPHSERITRIELPNESRGNLDAMYKAIGCDLVEPVYLNEARDAVFVDEEGLLKGPQHFFFIEGCHQPLAGRGVVLGCNEEGDSVNPVLTLDWLREHTAFVTRIGHGITAISAPQRMHGVVMAFFGG
jgi:hypothetical protein